MTPDEIRHSAFRNRLARLEMIAHTRPLAADARTRSAELRSRKEETKAARVEVETVASLAYLPDFFPTPRPLVERMLSGLRIAPGTPALEPSAGKGDIALALRSAGASVSCVEVAPALRTILAGKGFALIGSDFLDLQPDPRFAVVAMNPPFSGLADVAHVRHAARFLAPGGQLAAIMAEGAFFRECFAAVEFRVWLESVGGTSERLPPNTFSNAQSFRSTSVQTRLVRIHL